MNPNQPRRIILIDTPFQLRLAGAFILLQILLTASFASGLYAFLDSELQTGLVSAHAAYRSLDRMLMPLVLVLSGFSLAVSTVLATTFVVILSHRIAGPLHRFRTIMEGLAERRMAGHTRLRPKDQLGPLSECTGRALEIWRSDLVALQTALGRAQSSLEEGDLATARQSLSDLGNTLAQWRLSLPKA